MYTPGIRHDQTSLFFGVSIFRLTLGSTSRLLELVGPVVKSTAIVLLPRFYNPVRGGVYVDGKEILLFNIKNYRSYLALVSFEKPEYL